MKTKWMMRMLRKTTAGNSIVALAVGISLMTPKPALALSCDARSIERSYKKSDWVFLARVQDAQNTYSEKDPKDHRSLQKLKLKVLQAWKGRPPETMELEIYTVWAVLIYGTRPPLEVNQSYIFALTEEQTVAPFTFKVDCDYPWLANKAEKEINWLNSNTNNKKGE